MMSTVHQKKWSLKSSLSHYKHRLHVSAIYSHIACCTHTISQQLSALYFNYSVTQSSCTIVIIVSIQKAVSLFCLVLMPVVGILLLLLYSQSHQVGPAICIVLYSYSQLRICLPYFKSTCLNAADNFKQFLLVQVDFFSTCSGSWSFIMFYVLRFTNLKNQTLLNCKQPACLYCQP